MKPPPFSYHDPKTVADVVKLLDTLENSMLLAVGQSLMPMLRLSMKDMLYNAASARRAC